MIFLNSIFYIILTILIGVYVFGSCMQVDGGGGGVTKNISI